MMMMMMRGKKMMTMRGKIKERENESAVREDSTFFLYLYPLGFANGQPIYYFSHIRKSLYWIVPNRQGEKQFISFGF